MTDAKQSFPSGWHVREATRTLYNGLRRHLKMLLRLPAKPEAPVVGGPMETAVARYREICTKLLAELGPNPVLTDKVMCEAGAGDGLAVAALLISLSDRSRFSNNYKSKGSRSARTLSWSPNRFA